MQRLLLSFVPGTARSRATMCYRDVLGLTRAYEDTFSSVFSVAGITLQISTVADFSRTSLRSSGSTCRR